MILSTHILIAAAATKPIAAAHPFLIFLGAIASHYLSDLIPHWDYKLRSVKEKPHFDDPLNWSPHGRSALSDIIQSGLDCAFGAAVLFLIFYFNSAFDWQRFVAIVVGGVFPDGIKGIYYFLKKPKILRPALDFDRFMHTRIELRPYPLLGIPLQIVIFLVAMRVIA